MEPVLFSEGNLSAIDGADARHGLRRAVRALRIGPCRLARLARHVDKVSSDRFALEVHQVYRPSVVNDGLGQTATVVPATLYPSTSGESSRAEIGPRNHR